MFIGEPPENEDLPGEYDLAEICENGHVTNEHVRKHPDSNRKFCGECGAKTIQRCVVCDVPIVGAPYNTYGGFEAPSFCENCGQPHPWQKGKVIAAKAMAEDIEGLNHAEKELLKSNIDNITINSPMTEVAANRVKTLWPKLIGTAGEAFRKLIVDIASETGAKVLKGQ